MYKITSKSGVIIEHADKEIAKSFWFDGAEVIDEDTNSAAFSDLVKYYSPAPESVYPVWLSEYEKDIIVAHWEKTGMFPTIIRKIRSAESVKGTK